ncbi:MFS transporter [Staphylococcus haemolyticus]|uniref:MFS transporter n=1 Tax=Staphylococcus TaxID=1279 RepID=UPI00069EC51B|nr:MULTISPECIES: MFS transporter [Staphylococcus]MCE4953767.1 MFS transporter [Staphylococcus haemolyticus]MCH4532903.1 MFS transporter [Staphylococcus haemolyticus]MEB5761495.1 MFS transporter [Staphylococcus haemolyticus]UVD89308.1 MFS transporter [Staphylococcus haemolyticus]WAI19638.1 MAG: MFS transporter [Staphylococcus haemolyticus]
MFTLISIIGSELFIFALSFKLLYDYKSPLYFTSYLITLVIIEVLCSPLIGKLIDYYSKKKLVIIGQIINLVIIPIFIIFNQLLDNIITIFILLIILTITDIIVSLTFTSGLVEIVGNTQLEKAVSNREAIIRMVSIVAPILGGMIYAFIHLSDFLIIMLITECLSLLLFLFIKFNHVNPSENNNVITNESKATNIGILKFIKPHNDLIVLMSIGVITNFFLSFSNVGISTSFVQYFHMNSKSLGLIEAITTISMFFMAIIYPYIKILKSTFDRNIIGTMILGISMGMLAIPFFLHFNANIILVVYSVSRFLTGIGIQFMNISAMIYLQKVIPEKYKGRYFGFMTSIVQSIAPIGYLLAGVLFNISNIFYPILFSSILCASILISMLLKLNKKYERSI